MNEGARLLNDEQAAEVLAIRPGTLRHWRIAGRGPRWVKLAGRTVRYRLCDLEDWIEGQITEPGEQRRAVG